MRQIGDAVFLSPSEAGKVLGVHRRTILRWCSETERPADAPDLKAHHAPNRRVLFPESHIKSLVDEIYKADTDAKRSG